MNRFSHKKAYLKGHEQNDRHQRRFGLAPFRVQQRLLEITQHFGIQTKAIRLNPWVLDGPTKEGHRHGFKSIPDDGGEHADLGRATQGSGPAGLDVDLRTEGIDKAFHKDIEGGFR